MFRDCKEFLNQNLPLSTTSNSACKLFDCALSQYITWREDPNYNGLESTLSSMLSEDPNFIMGHILKQGISIIGNSGYIPMSISESLSLSLLANKYSKNITNRELMHVEAIELAARGDLPDACIKWEEILSKNPTDIVAVKFAHDSYFYLGDSEQIRDSIARILPFWDKSLPYYSYLYGMLSFGLAETNNLNEAEKNALKGLELNPKDGWSTHSIAHVKEYRNESKEGIKFLNETEKDWEICDMIKPHLYWHLCLYHIENNEHEIAIKIAKSKIVERAIQTKSSYDLADAISLFYRLKLDGCKYDFTNDLKKLIEACRDKSKDHGYIFNDLHILMLLTSNEEEELINDYLDSFNSFINNPSKDYIRDINRELGATLNKSLIDFKMGNYENVVDNLAPIKYKWKKIGGSNAQRDLFHQILVNSAFKSKKTEHNILAKGWTNERLCIKPNSLLNNRFLKNYYN